MGQRQDSLSRERLPARSGKLDGWGSSTFLSRGVAWPKHFVGSRDVFWRKSRFSKRCWRGFSFVRAICQSNLLEETGCPIWCLDPEFQLDWDRRFVAWERHLGHCSYAEWGSLHRLCVVHSSCHMAGQRPWQRSGQDDHGSEQCLVAWKFGRSAWPVLCWWPGRERGVGGLEARCLEAVGEGKKDQSWFWQGAVVSFQGVGFQTSPVFWGKADCFFFGESWLHFSGYAPKEWYWNNFFPLHYARGAPKNRKTLSCGQVGNREAAKEKKKRGARVGEGWKKKSTNIFRSGRNFQPEEVFFCNW